MADPLASVIILGWGGEPYIAPCLNALRQQTYKALEILVVDNGSPDRTAEIVERGFSEVRLIRTGENLGVAGGNNVGLRAAQGDICVLINADVVVRPDWLEHLVGSMQANPQIGIAGAKLLYPDGTIQFAGGLIEAPRGYTYHVGWHEEDRGQYDTLSDVDLVTGASLAISRPALEQIGYEDERFFPIDYEDADMSYRARAAGFRVVLVPQAAATHHESSTLQAGDLARALALEAGRLRFVCKHWPHERLLGEFLPAELDFLGTGPPHRETLFKWVYLKALHDIDDLVNWRQKLGLGQRIESLSVLSELLTQLHRACLPQFAMAATDERLTRILESWFAPANGRPDLLLSLHALNPRVESHSPIAWPDWPPGIWPKVVALSQKVARRLLRWYIDPIVQQQNVVNAAFLHALETLSQEVIELRGRQAAHDAVQRDSLNGS
ncbi:MAG: glycosyltransferase family 2 protein [Anaerolineae bacterium]|nr:glycosyltransferase family 2 protein [Anaerolineae bacterium]